MDNFFYFNYDLKTKILEKITYNNFNINEDFYKENYFFICTFKEDNIFKILNSPQLDDAILNKRKKYLKYFLNESFNQLYKEVDCFDWIQENKNIVRRLMK